jgi:hypothetical protein
MTTVVKSRLTTWHPFEWTFEYEETFIVPVLIERLLGTRETWMSPYRFLQSGLINLSKNNNLLGVITSRRRREVSKLYPMNEVPDGPLPFPVKVETHNITYSTSHEKGI